MPLNFDSSTKYLAGVGKKRQELLEKMGIYTLEDVLYHFPRAYQNRGKILSLAMTPDGTNGAFLLTVATKPQTVMLKNRMQLTKFVAFDDTGRCTVTFFNQPYVKDIFHVGDEFRFYGRLTVKRSSREMSAPIFEPVVEGKKLPDLVPVYPLTEGINQKFMRALVENSVNTLESEGYEYPEIFDGQTLENMGLMGLKEALYEIHFPTDAERLKSARERFVFEELYSFALGISLTKRNDKTGNAQPFTDTCLDEFYAELPYKLTNAQARSVNEIVADLSNKNGIPMNRLLSGDVGSGKTVCAAAAVYLAVKNNTQAAFMVPTEILANQHYNDLKDLFGRLRMRVALLTGSTSAASKREIINGVASGEIHIVIGTHALLNDKLVFDNLGLVITDEQHRFGVKQRATLAEKTKAQGKSVHVLVMSATPIPRTLALILYGDLSVSAIDELPPGRQKVDTFLVDENYRDRLNGFIRKNATEHQVYIVCPMVEEKQDDDDEGLLPFDFMNTDETITKQKVYSAKEYAEKLSNEVFPDISVGCIHGKLKPAEKDRIMREFEEGRIRILVSTTVIEVGVNVPNAVLMVVENAERFGLSQLHQLRGRVGRGSAKSYCVLVSSSETDKAKKRLNVMCQTNNGYKIAEADLEQRGPGDFFPDRSGDARQSGGLKFRFASLCDMELLTKAFTLSESVLKKDPLLISEQNSGARRYMKKLFERLHNS
ncbi:MAG: ATP-dependent DNA helicase RecG [Clostridia bacterium]|nr:ATP-dependent DNA helicase RecG [Clostridia bacterium]